MKLYIIVFHLLTFGKCFIFTTIIAIYNVGRYLDDSIGSLISQTIGFKNIQIILVNDGSNDYSEEKCLEYQNIYKNNIIYIKINHSGVSKARNAGMIYSDGTYINFLDADDKWDHQAFQYFLYFFENYTDIDFVAGRIQFFEAEKGYHPLDYKFYKTRIVNLSQEYNSIQLSASSSIFKKSSLEGKYFSENVLFCEDSRFVNNILIHKPIYGLVKEAIYYYRRRYDFSSAINNQKNKLEFYFDTINNVYYYLLSCSKLLYNIIIPFIQFLIIYDLLWRIQAHTFYFLGWKNFNKYKMLIEGLLKQIDDKFFFEQKIALNKYKLFMLSVKYQKDLRYEIKLKENFFIYSNYVLINLNNEKNIINWRMLNIKNNVLYLEAIDNLWFPRENYYYFCTFGKKNFFPKYFENSHYDFYTMYGLIQKGRTLIFEIPLEIKNDPQILYFYISYMDNNKEIFTSLGLYSHLPPLSNGYYVSGNYIIKYIENRIILFHYTPKLENEFEIQYCNELYKTKKDYIVPLRNYIKNNIKEKDVEIWIINDKRDRAGDNGEYFFRYLKLKNQENLNIYFAIEKNCEDYKRLEKLGNILDLNSNEYKRTFLESNKIISSIYDDWVDNPFQEDRNYLIDLFHFDFIFLKNGITTCDLSISLNRFNKNYSLIITSSENEYKSFLNYNYGYNEKNIILTGMPRFDNLENHKNSVTKEKKIIIIPTWRNSIKGKKELNDNKRIYSNEFKKTEYCIFYNELINNERLLYIMKHYNYTGTLCLHHFLESQLKDFSGNEIFSVMTRCDYQNLLLKSSLLITDYSNIFFDFGYIRKPVVYVHFDFEEFKNTHSHKGFFDYKRNGFGTICNDINSTINEIIFEIENNCTLRKKFVKRIEKFFAFTDNNNNERIFNEIKSKIKTTKNKNEKFSFEYAFFLFLMIKLISKYYENLFNISNKDD